MCLYVLERSVTQETMISTKDDLFLIKFSAGPPAILPHPEVY